MTPTEHLERAEQLLEQLRNGEGMAHDYDTMGMALEATGHALVAIADVLGVSHTSGSHPALTNAN